MILFFVLLFDRLHDLLLLVDHLQGIGTGVPPFRHQVRNRQHRANQNLFVVFACIRSHFVVRQHGSDFFRRVDPLEFVELVTNLSQQAFGFLRSPGGQFDDGFIEQQDVFFAFVLFQFLLDVLIRRGQIAIKECRTNRLKPVEVSTAAGQCHQQRKDCP